MKIAKINHVAFSQYGEIPGFRFCLITGETAKLTGEEIAEKLFNYYNNPASPFYRRADGENVPDEDIQEIGRTGRCYSLSVGDTVKMEDEEKAWKCVSFGWEREE